MVTIFKDLYSKEPNHIELSLAIERIKNGNSSGTVEAIRKEPNKQRATELKKSLPCVLFSGEFKSRDDKALVKHSGLIVLDFDNVSDLREKQGEIIQHDFIYACWVSPSGNGLKALAKIADTTKHREHFAALQETFPGIDRSGVNEARVCFESYDPDLYLNEQAKPFTKLKTVAKIEIKQNVEDERFSNLEKWLQNKNETFSSGNRNMYIFKLAGACCRYGLTQDETERQVLANYRTDNEFTDREAIRAINSAYKQNAKNYNTAVFEKTVFVDSVTRSEVKPDNWEDTGEGVQDVIYAKDVKDKALNIFHNGYETALGIGVPELDYHFRLNRGEVTLLTGIGNHGKSQFLQWFLLMRAIQYGEKFAFFPPEDNPAEHWYHALTETLLAANCTKESKNRPDLKRYEAAYDWIGKHFFDVYPKDAAPSPDYLKERFLSLIIKEKVSGCIIDPFNQMSNDYKSTGGRTDQYLESVLGNFGRFIQDNEQYGIIVAHPNKLTKQQDGNYPCPDVFDIAGGAMWNNKMHNIIAYHRPVRNTDPLNPLCEFHSLKIKKQKTVGLPGSTQFIFNRETRRFEFTGGTDFMKIALNSKGIEF